ncbi:MAG: CHAP domain-containing protein, partial [Pseudomonadota bacterium]
MKETPQKTNAFRPFRPAFTRAALALCLVTLISACAQNVPDVELQLDPQRQSMALREVAQKHAAGHRVWCVPYARNLSGIQIRGNAKDWWGKALGRYERGAEPMVGAVMSFRATRGMRLGHVAVVSDIVSAREVVINHANWHRNRVSLEMSVMDVSENNDWTQVRVESNPGQFGKINPVNGFIY